MTQYATKSEKVSLLSLPADYARNMKEQPKYKWYKPILAFLVAFVLYFLFGAVVEVAKMLYMGLAVDPTAISIAKDAYMSVDFSDPFQIFFAVAAIAVMIPAFGISMKIFGLGGLRALSSAEGGMRWDRILKLALPVFVLTVVLILATSFIPMMADGSIAELGAARFVPLAIVAIILFVPFQCAAEEYAFRGFAIQTFASWIPVVAVSVVLQALVFGFSHAYNIVGILGIAIDGFLWGWITVKTGGIEASICMHAANNVTAMLITSIWASAAVTTTISIQSAIINILCHVVVCAFTYYLCKRNGYLISDKPAAEAIVE